MNTSLSRQFDIFFKLFKTRIMITYDQIIDKIINTHFWTFCTLFVFGHLMQSFGLTSDYGVFQLAGIIGTLGLFEVYGSASVIVMDLEGDQSIAYYLTLPTTPFVVLASMAASFAAIGFLISMAIIPLGKILLWNMLSLTAISWIKLVIIAILANIFFGMFTLSIAAQVGRMSRISNVWMRFIFPLWFLGGFQFSWQAGYNLSKPLAYIMLANPIVYVMEGIRAAVIGQDGFLSWWLCVGMLCIFSALCSLHAYHRMKKLLDFV